MGERSAGPHRGGDEGGFGDFLLAGAMGTGVPGVGVDAIGALGGEGYAERDQFAVFAGDFTIAAFNGIVEGQKGAALGGRKPEEIGNESEVFAPLVVAHGKWSSVHLR